tara:strand:- start:408 stop:1556 length:1149 start_codon:yes stop_codon:yes gene_type:complete
MERRLKFKVYGESPRSLLLAFFLAKIKCDIYIIDPLINSKTYEDKQIFTFSNFSKYLLSKFDIWDEFEDISYGFTSLRIIDNLVSEQLLLRAENFHERYLNTFGWTTRYTDIKSLLLNKLINFDNVYFISKNQLSDESLIFDYEFNFKSYNKILNLFNYPLSILKRIDEHILIFDVYIRGNVERRLYEINTTDGLLVLTPINKNLYQIIWYNSSDKIIERSLSSKSFFLDNLTAILPNEIKVDQIIGDINFYHVNNIDSFFLINNKSIYFNENKYNSNTLCNLEFENIIKSTLKICNFLENNDAASNRILNKLGFCSLLIKYEELLVKFSFSSFIINLLITHNVFLSILRKILFTLIKRINLFKILIMRKLSNSNINNFNLN